MKIIAKFETKFCDDMTLSKKATAKSYLWLTLVDIGGIVFYSWIWRKPQGKEIGVIVGSE